MNSGPVPQKNKKCGSTPHYDHFEFLMIPWIISIYVGGIKWKWPSAPYLLTVRPESHFPKFLGSIIFITSAFFRFLCSLPGWQNLNHFCRILTFTYLHYMLSEVRWKSASKGLLSTSVSPLCVYIITPRNAICKTQYCTNITISNCATGRNAGTHVDTLQKIL